MLIHNKKSHFRLQGEPAKHFHITWVFTQYKQSDFCNPFKGFLTSKVFLWFCLFPTVWTRRCAENSEFIPAFKSLWFSFPDQEILKVLYKYRFITVYFPYSDCIHHHNLSGLPWRQQVLNNWWKPESCLALWGSACKSLMREKGNSRFETSGSRQAAEITSVFRHAKHLVLRQCNTVSLQCGSLAGRDIKDLVCLGLS